MPNFHIKRAKLDGYRNIRGTEATFCDGLNIIIGPNGCGKSNFLWLLDNITENDFTQVGVFGEFEIYQDEDNFIKNLSINVQHILEQDEKGVKATKQISFGVMNDTGHDQTAFIKIGKYILERSLLVPFNIPYEIFMFTKPSKLIVKKNDRFLFPMTTNKVIHRMFYDKSLDNTPKINTYNLDYFSFDTEIVKKLAEYTPIKDISIKYPLSNRNRNRN
jgi:AAA15 family ATPase/GTPase